MLLNSGAEAVEAAIKLARARTGRVPLAHLAGSFHGKTVGALSLTDATLFRDGLGPLLPEVVRLFLFVLGWLTIGLRVRGSLLALLVIMVALAACVVSFALALCAVSPSRRQAFAVERMVTLTWTVFGGALVPTELMADWIGWVARFTPVYWAVGGFRKVVLDSAGVADVVPNAGALLAFATVFTTLAVRRFTMDTDRRHWV
ncbi:ABC transporter permease [Streptomyces mirabilis]|uniref:ABC transporter permease n=1 Tax=Streptomyces mirabilis TaxID=68239 RepID=UPI00368E9363